MPKADNLKPQDVLVTCKLLSMEESRFDHTYAGLGRGVGLSASEAHAAVERCRRAQLLTAASLVQRRYLLELLVSGVPRIYYPSRGGIASGMLTSVYAPPVAKKISPSLESLPTVWPCPQEVAVKQSRGESVVPIYPTVPQACAADPYLYELMALAEVVRVGRPSEKDAAVTLLEKLITPKRAPRLEADATAPAGGRTT